MLFNTVKLCILVLFISTLSVAEVDFDEESREKRQLPNFGSTLNTLLQTLLNLFTNMGGSYYVRTPYMDAGSSTSYQNGVGSQGMLGGGGNFGQQYPSMYGGGMPGFGGPQFMGMGRRKRQSGGNPGMGKTYWKRLGNSGSV